MTQRFFIAATLGFLLSACAGSPTAEAPAPAAAPEPAADLAPAPAELDPTGSYDIVVALEGMEINGVMTIEGSAAEGYTGYIDSEMGGAAMANIVVEGQIMSFDIPDAGAMVEVEFDGDEFAGMMTGGMGEALFEGVKR